MTRHCIALCAFGTVFSIVASAGDTRSIVFKLQENSQRLTGDVRTDLFGSHDFTAGPQLTPQGYDMDEFQHKSPWLAAGMSLVIPGAGEFYAESYWKSAAFLVVGVAAWTVAAVQNSKGNTQTKSFEGFADRNWSVVEYASFSFNNLLPPSEQPTYANWRIAGTENRSPFDRPWEQVNWSVVNAMERAIGSTTAGRYYSHTLPRYGEQQYYELVGKYPQYNQGWIDASPGWVYDPLNEGNVTANFNYYSGERRKANDFYANASTAVTVAVVNHILSAADAAWSASRHNKLHATLGLQAVPGPFELERAAVLRLKFDL
ncbi:MAG TPA: hypothetical protein VGB89_10405 [Bacteroidota bacterium]